MESFREEVRLWRQGDSFEPRPPPLIIETYLDTNDLTPTQALVILDGENKRWNVTEALQNAAARAGLNAGGNGTRHQIVLERWKVELRYVSLFGLNLAHRPVPHSPPGGSTCATSGAYE
jgi:autophagy-related protein 13